MFELPEAMVLTRQMNEHLCGKVIEDGSLGNSPHKFAWYNRSEAEFRSLIKGKKIGKAWTKGRWMIIEVGSAHHLVFGETGGSLILHRDLSTVPEKYHFLLRFSDHSALTLKIQMWGAMELFDAGDELNRAYIRDMAPTPLDEEFSRQYFMDLVKKLCSSGKRSVKSLLTQEQIIPGLGNSCAQDIMFVSGQHPRKDLASLSQRELNLLHDSILRIVNQIIELGGRNDESDLFGNKGRYQRIMDAAAVGMPCPKCGESVQKIQYLGGACYFCPNCQNL
ncbi:MAG: DNA-formamidopyrimidine glycosylase family protein [Candidatus Cloacimonadaceae bacterium]|nr:hypothetical protein [Candidatus Cloacimonadota bacterium]